MPAKKAAVAGSVQGPATIDPATVAESALGAAEVESSPQPFPREITVINDTPMNYTVARTYVPAHGKVAIVVRDEDEITRIQTDCAHLMSLAPAHDALEVQPLRVIDAAAE